MAEKTYLRRLAAWSIAVSLFVMALKFWAWWITGSVALFSDALESIVNVIASVIALYALHVSHKPADAEHPFGHHKAEYMSAVVEGVLIVIAALLIFRQAWSALLEPIAIEEPLLGLAVNAAAAVLNAVWAWLLISTGRRARSPALTADGQHIRADVITSIGVVAGLLLALATGWLILDPLIAVVVGINVLWQGWKVIGNSIQGLMDAAVDEEEAERIRAIIAANAAGAIEVHDIKTRMAARATFIEFHLVVDASMDVGTAHRICERIENALKREIQSVRVIIHVEPDHEAKPAGSQSALILT